VGERERERDREREEEREVNLGQILLGFPETMDEEDIYSFGLQFSVARYR
jgi:hypothetical protein